MIKYKRYSTGSEWFKSKIKITRSTPADGNTKDVKRAILLKYLSNFWKTLEFSLINCEINLILKWLLTCVIINLCYHDWWAKLLWSTSKKWYENIWYHSQNYNWLRWWLYNWVFIRLSLFQKTL